MNPAVIAPALDNPARVLNANTMRNRPIDAIDESAQPDNGADVQLLATASARGVVVVAPEGSARWANRPAMEWLGAEDVTELQRRWSSVALTLPLAQGASAGSEPAHAVLRLGHGATARTLRCEINAVDDSGGWVVVLRADDDAENEALLLANDAIVAPLLAGKMVHDVRGGMAEATMAVASAQTVVQSARQHAELDKLEVASDRLRFVLAGCARGSAALDAWASALGVPAATKDPHDVDLRKVFLALPSLLQLPALMRLIDCDVTAGDDPRWTPGNESRVRAALVGLSQHLIAGAAEGARFTCQFVTADAGAHTIEMAVDRFDGKAGDDDISPYNTVREPIALRAAGAAIGACGGAVTKVALRKDDGVRFRVTLPVSVRADMPGSDEGDF